jgi:hypothetical protein
MRSFLRRACLLSSGLIFLFSSANVRACGPNPLSLPLAGGGCGTNPCPAYQPWNEPVLAQNTSFSVVYSGLPSGTQGTLAMNALDFATCDMTGNSGSPTGALPGNGSGDSFQMSSGNFTNVSGSNVKVIFDTTTTNAKDPETGGPVVESVTTSATGPINATITIYLHEQGCPNDETSSGPCFDSSDAQGYQDAIAQLVEHALEHAMGVGDVCDPNSTNCSQLTSSSESNMGEWEGTNNMWGTNFITPCDNQAIVVARNLKAGQAPCYGLPGN